MPRKTIIIFITVFVIIGGLMLGFYYYYNKSNSKIGTNTNTGFNPFNPFGSSNTNNTTTDTTPTTDDNTNDIPQAEQVPEPIIVKLHKITDFAVAGATYFEDERPILEPTKDPNAPIAEVVPEVTTKIVNGKKVTVATKPIAPKFDIVPSLRYVERATGHIYQIYLDTKGTGKISNSTIPGISEVLFDSTAKSVIYRYLSSDNNTISSFIATLGSQKSEFLPSNIINISTSRDGTRFFYLAKTSSGVIGTIRLFGESKSSQVWTSPHTEWTSEWVGKDKIYLTTKPSWAVDGSVFSLNTLNGSLTKVFGGVRGLSTLANSDGSTILYSTSGSTESKLGILDVKNHTTSDINTYGLAEKCVWSIDNVNIYCAVPNTMEGREYPDSWYQGLNSFDDRFVKINSVSGEVISMANSINTESVDATNLFLNKNETELYFVNKKDSTLWSLDLK